MSVSEAELGSILSHCRQLLDAATELNGRAVGRHADATEALRLWTGEHADTFRARMTDEADDLSEVSRQLRADADEWARIWADTINHINRQRREAAVDAERAARGAGERQPGQSPEVRLPRNPRMRTPCHSPCHSQPQRC